MLVCAGIPAQLNASGGVKYVWSPSIGLDNPYIANPIININSESIYFVNVIDGKGCSKNDSIHIFISSHGVQDFKMANAFTPNNDGKNDCFGVRKWGNVTISEFSIFNRWGQRIFTTKNANDCWDGTFKGLKQDPGGYVYIIKAKTVCGEVSLKGVVMLIR